MKNISLALNVVLLIAVGVLYYLFFKSQGSANNNVAVKDSTTTELPDFEKYKVKIAYINYDSLTQNYDFYKKGLSDLERKFYRKQQELTDKAQKLEEEYITYEQTAPTMTENYRATKEKDLMQKQQELIQLRETYTKQQMSEEENFNKTFLKKIDEYLKNLSKEKDYSYVFTYSKGGFAAIVFANDSLEITSQVVNGLNKEFKASQSQTKK